MSTSDCESKRVREAGEGGCFPAAERESFSSSLSVKPQIPLLKGPLIYS